MNNCHIGLLILLIIALCIIGMLMHDKPSAVVNEIIVVDTTERDSLLEVIHEYEQDLQWWRGRLPIVETKYILIAKAIDTLSADSATAYFADRTDANSVLLGDSLVQTEIEAIRNANRLFVERDMLVEKIGIKDSIIGIQDGIISAYLSRDSLFLRENDMYRMLANKYYLWYDHQQALSEKRGEIIKWGGASLGVLFILALIF
jgi:hypothetical protein